MRLYVTTVGITHILHVGCGPHEWDIHMDDVIDKLISKIKESVLQSSKGYFNNGVNNKLML